MSIQANIKNILADIPDYVKLIAVSKYHPGESIMEAYTAGQRFFGENKVQEMTQKHEMLPNDIKWHLIGHLQSNKVKYIVSYVSMIESIDSFKLLCEVNKQAAKVNRIIPCLLQIHIAKEDTKFGFSFDECREMLMNENWKELRNIEISGVMGMATNTEDESEVKDEFNSLYNFFEKIKNDFFPDSASFKEISMGMSHDYKLAIECGSTMVRVGSKIFGERVYK